MIQPTTVQVPESSSIVFQGWPLGLRTDVPASMLLPSELSECIDFKILRGGKLESRDPMVVYSNSAITGSAVNITTAILDGVSYDFLAGSDNKIYYLDGSLDPVVIGTAEGPVYMMPYNNQVVVFDGGYLKYIDSTLTLKLAYDDGDGDSGGSASGIIENIDPTAGATGYRDSSYLPSFVFDTDDKYIGSTQANHSWMSAVGVVTNQRVWCKIESPGPVDLIKIINGNATTGAQNVKVYLDTRDTEPSDTYANDISNMDLLYDGSLTQRTTYTTPGYDELPVGNLENYYYIIIDIADNFGDASYIGLRAVEIISKASTPGSFYNNISGDNDTTIDMYSGSVIRSGVRFLTQDIPTGHTIPPTGLTAFLKRTGSPTGAITATIYNDSDVVMASQIIYQDAGDIATAGEEVSVVFANEEINEELEPDIEYKAVFEFSGGDSSNYISLCGTTVVGTGQAVKYTSSWAEDLTIQPMITVKPGMPIKAQFGAIWQNRPMAAGVGDNDGRVYFGAFNIFDWSTAGSSGYIDVVDNARNSFKIGGMQDLMGDFFVFGDQTSPYLCRLTGSTPSEYALPAVFQRSWTSQKCLVNTVNDLWYASADGVDNLSGVQEFGDVRTFSVSDPVNDRLVDWDADSFAGYFPEDGIFMMSMGGRMLCSNTKAPTSGPEGTRYPWFEYDLPVTVTGMGQIGTGFVFGADDGKLYKFNNTSSYKDLDTTQISPKWKSSYVTIPLGNALLQKVQLIANSRSGAILELAFYKDNRFQTPTYTYTFQIPWQDDLLLKDAFMELQDANFALGAEVVPLWKRINITVNSIMIGVDVTTTLGSPVVFDGVIIQKRNLYR